MRQKDIENDKQKDRQTKKEARPTEGVDKGREKMGITRKRK